MPGRPNLGGLENSLPSWISYITDEVNMSPSLPKRNFSSSEGSPLEVSLPSLEKENIMTLDDLDRLRESYSILPCVQIRIHEAGETISSARLGEVAFYEVAFHVDLQFSIHPKIKMILQFYNICPTQLIPNAWQSVICAIVL